MPGPGERGTLHRRAPWALFFIKPPVSIAENVADFPNKEKQTQRGRQNETEEYATNERTGENTK